MSVTLYAQHPVYYNLGVDDGLPGSTAYYVLTDQKGYVWVATEFGVSRYNGRTFTNYTKKDGLGDNVVFCLAEDPYGRIFAGCQNGTVSYFDGVRFKSIAGNDSLAFKINQSGGIINTLEFDPDLTLWVGTSRTLYEIDPQHDYSRVKENLDYDQNALCVIRQFADGKNVESQYFNTHQKQKAFGDSILIFAQVITAQGEKSDLLPVRYHKMEVSNPRMVSLTTQAGELYFSYQNKLFSYSESGFLKVAEFSKTILFLFEDADRNLYVSIAHNGVLLFEKGDLSAQPVTLFSGNSIGSIQQDFQNGIWFSSVNKGVFVIPDIHHTLFTRDGIQDGIVGIYQHKNHVLAVSTIGQLIDLSQGVETDSGTMPRLYEKNAISRAGFFEYNDKLIVFGSGVIAFDVETGSSKSYTFSAYQMFATGVAADDKNELYATTLNEICLLKEDRWHLITKLPAKGSCLWYNHKDSCFWVGTRSGLYSWKNNQFVKYPHPELESEHIVCMVSGIRNEVYLGTKNSGLFMLKDNVWKNISTKDGLASDYCNHIYVDAMERVWVSTNKGISFFYEGHPEIIQTINRNNGLMTDEISATTVIDNTLFVAGTNGVVKIDIDRIADSTTFPRVYISDVTVSGNPVGSARTFNWDETNFRFYVDCLNYRNRGVNSYHYQLIGYDEAAQVTHSNYVEYANLPSGQFTFKVQPLNSENQPVGKAEFLKFEITPPFWVELWFILLCIFFAGILIYYLFRWRIAGIRKKEQVKRKLDKLIAESQITAIRAQMNPHFIFNAINSIQDYILHNQTQEAYDYLAKFAKLIRMVLNHSKQNQISLKHEIQWLKLYVELEQMRFKNCFQFEIDLGNLTEDDLELTIPNMVVQPFIENAIWHGFMPLKGERAGLLKLSFHLGENSLLITVEDNGAGRKDAMGEAKRTSHGTQLIQDKLTMINQLNQTQSNYVIYDLKENGKPVGTKISLTLEFDHENKSLGR